MNKLRQRGPDGWPIGSNQVMREAYGRIPNTNMFQNGYGYEKVHYIKGWEWSDTFGRWGAYVTFPNEYSLKWTWPKPC